MDDIRSESFTSNNNNNNNSNSEVLRNNGKTALQNELDNIINENNNIGREIYKMNNENKKLIKLLQSFASSSNISNEKRKNLEMYITSQASLLNNAKKIFVEEYNKMKNMEQEINNLKTNNTYMKNKLKECRENEYRMKIIQSSKDKFVLHTLSANARRNLSTSSIFSSSESVMTEKYQNYNNNINNNKTIRLDKDARIFPKWKHHEDTCNQQ